MIWTIVAAVALDTERKSAYGYSKWRTWYNRSSSSWQQKKNVLSFWAQRGDGCGSSFFTFPFFQSLFSCAIRMNVYTRTFFVHRKEAGSLYSYKKEGTIGTREDEPPPQLFFFLSSSSPLCVGGLLCISVTCLGRRRVIEEGVTKPGRWFFPSLNERIREHFSFLFARSPPSLCLVWAPSCSAIANKRNAERRASLIFPILRQLHPLLAFTQSECPSPTFNFCRLFDGQWTVSLGVSLRRPLKKPERLQQMKCEHNGLFPNSYQHNLICTICVCADSSWQLICWLSYFRCFSPLVLWPWSLWQ